MKTTTKKSFLLLAFFCIFNFLLFSQNENNKWVVGVGINVVDYYPTNEDNMGGFFNEITNANDHWNIYGPKIHAARFIRGKVNLGASFSLNKISKLGDIPVNDEVSPTVTLVAGTYTVTLTVDDGIDSDTTTVSFTLTDGTLADLLGADPVDYTLNGVPASEVKGDDSVVISFADNDIAATVEVGLDVDMVLDGAATGTDYIDVIQDKENDQGKGKSNLKGKGK